MRTEKVIKISIIFLLGFLSANLVSYYFVYGLESPFSNNFGVSLSSDDAPADFLQRNDIKVYDDRIVIEIDDASVGKYAATGSMKPVLDENTNGIRIKPDSEDEIDVGDIITFEQENMLIIHRVIDKGIDSNGTYFITKGDNNALNDGKIRYDQIKYKTIGFLY